MKFGAMSPAAAVGGVTVHTIRQNGYVLKKGTLIGAAEVEALAAAGIAEVVVAKLDEGDVSEDEAAASIAKAIGGRGVSVEKAVTGRSNLFAETAGVLVVDRAAVDRINRVDEAITLATLPNFKSVVAGEMIATVKIVPFGMPARLRDAALQAVAGQKLRVEPYRISKVGIVSTELPGLAPKVIEKTLTVTAKRLAPAGASILMETRLAHDERLLADEIAVQLARGAELVIVFGASAIADRRDVIPAAITRIGGRVEHFGMPVDPGNLMLIGEVKGVPVIGAPGCARSPKENGFDWILMRMLAGVKVTREDITALGVGGLLMEIVTRPQPRVAPVHDGNSRIAAVILAAGRSSRMGGANKLLEKLGDKPLVRIVAEQALASKARPVLVVTGHQSEQVRAALAGLDVQFVPNANYADGISTSVTAGIRAVPADADGALICLGDMPLIDAKLIDRLIEALSPEQGLLIAVPASDGRRGNPVLWSRRFFDDLMLLEGDVGGRPVIGKYPEAVVEVAAEGGGAFVDIDTPDALADLRRR